MARMRALSAFEQIFSGSKLNRDASSMWKYEQIHSQVDNQQFTMG